jgi:hypothetical protein
MIAVPFDEKDCGMEGPAEIGIAAPLPDPTTTLNEIPISRHQLPMGSLIEFILLGCNQLRGTPNS